jgi:hypothetical protein
MRYRSLRVLLGLSVYATVASTGLADSGSLHISSPALRRRLSNLISTPSRFDEHNCDVAMGQTWCASKKKCELVDDYDCPGMDAFQAEAYLVRFSFERINIVY